jgi:hypothetical protein
VTKDYVDQTLWSGLAVVGGVWTFINGVFSAIFGCTLLLVLFGARSFPLEKYAFH